MTNENDQKASPSSGAAEAESAAPAAEKEAPAKEKGRPKSRSGSGPKLSRRGLFSWAAVAWVGFTAAIGGCMAAFGRFMFPNVLFEPPTSFKVGVPEDFPEGVVDERYKESNGIWIVHNEGRLYALIAICTHLGCPPAWLEAQNKFKCPCHGSGYYKDGINFEGPTPRPLERAKVSIDPSDGQIVVDKAQKYQWELGQWDDPSSFIEMI
jgi:cytochrome b6-f complex iron-sulfur subunit